MKSPAPSSTIPAPTTMEGRRQLKSPDFSAKLWEGRLINDKNCLHGKVFFVKIGVGKSTYTDFTHMPTP